MAHDTPTRILVVEDDADLRRWLCRELAHEGYEPDGVATGPAALEAVRAGSYDLVLLDVMLPGISGVEVCRRLRTGSDLPVILVTARDAVTDRVAGLDAGADDYLGKPFAIEELLARIRALLRRVQGRAGAADRLVCGPLVVDVSARTVTVDGNPVELTRTEFDLLAHFAAHAGIVQSREAILRSVWGYDFVGESKVVDVYVRYLRSKLDDRFGLRLIHTVRGVGYVLRADGPSPGDG